MAGIRILVSLTPRHCGLRLVRRSVISWPPALNVLSLMFWDAVTAQMLVALRVNFLSWWLGDLRNFNGETKSVFPLSQLNAVLEYISIWFVCKFWEAVSSSDSESLSENASVSQQQDQSALHQCWLSLPWCLGGFDRRPVHTFQAFMLFVYRYRFAAAKWYLLGLKQLLSLIDVASHCTVVISENSRSDVAFPIWSSWTSVHRTLEPPGEEIPVS